MTTYNLEETLAVGGSMTTPPLQHNSKDFLMTIKVVLTTTGATLVVPKYSSDNGNSWSDLNYGTYRISSGSDTRYIPIDTSADGLFLIQIANEESSTTNTVTAAITPDYAKWYVTVDDVRDYTKVTSTEYSDEQVQKMIRYACRKFDFMVGRTWLGTFTVTDEYHNGDGSDELQLDRSDIVSLTSLSIDDDEDDTYTSVTTSTVRIKSDLGIIKLTDDSEVTQFPDNNFNSIKASYTYGSTNVSEREDIRWIILDMVMANLDADKSLHDKTKEDIKMFANQRVIAI